MQRERPRDPHFEAAIALEDVPAGQMRACLVGGRDLLVCHTRDGLFVVDNVCSHAYARMSEGRLRGVRLTCPLHGAVFDVRDGRVLKGPATEPLPTHQVRVMAGDVQVALDPDAPPALAAY